MSQQQFLTKEKATLGENLIMMAQHLFTMFPSTIAVPLILAGGVGLGSEDTAVLIASALFVSAIATLLQAYGKFGIGAGMPQVVGPAFDPLGAMIIIGSMYGMQSIFGAVIASAILMFISTFWVDKILKFFPPIVIGCILLFLGVALANTAFADIVGGFGSPTFGELKNFLLGMFVFIFILCLTRYGSEKIKQVSILIGLVVGVIVAIPLGMLDLTPVQEASWFKMVNPFHFGMPTFQIDAILIMFLFSLTTMLSSVGIYPYMDSIRGTKTDEETQVAGMRGLAVTQLFAGVFNSFPTVPFIANVSVIKLTKISARSTMAFTGGIILLISLMPKFSALITCVPAPVIGAVTLTLLCTLISVGVSILASLDYSKGHNGLVVGTTLGIGAGSYFTAGAFDQMPEIVGMLLGNVVFVVAVVSIVLNLLFNRPEKEEA